MAFSFTIMKKKLRRLWSKLLITSTVNKVSISHDLEIYSKDKKKWDVSQSGFWVGGHYPVSNLSQGYHAIQKQWWDAYMTGKSVLLISETRHVKQEFQMEYPEWEFYNLDFYPEIAASSDNHCDIYGDICATPSPCQGKSFDLIINQATLEHLYNPFGAMNNLVNCLSDNGVLVSHTHPPQMGYHGYPRDYFRFMKDWWYDLPKWIPGIEMMELVMVDNLHVFTCYRKIDTKL